MFVFVCIIPFVIDKIFVLHIIVNNAMDFAE